MVEVKKAITFRASSIGDCLMGKYLLDNVHATYPQALLGIVVASRGGMIRDLLSSSPYIEVIEANRRDIPGLFKLWKKYTGSDVVVTQYAGKIGGQFSLLSKIFARLLSRRGGFVGFEDTSVMNSFLMDHMVGPVLGVSPAKLERAALTVMGLPVVVPNASLTPTPTPGVIEEFGLDKTPYILVHLFAGNKGRGLSPAKKRELAEALVRARPNTRVVLSGMVGEFEEAMQVVQGLPVTVIAGKTTLQELMNLIMGSVGVISVDTGVAHMAAQLGKPLVVMATCLGLHWWKEEQYGAGAKIQLCTYSEPSGHISKEYPDCINKIDMHEVAKGALTIGT